MSRIQKMFSSKKPQLRRCAFCDKPGHNKSTCEAFRATLIVPQIESQKKAALITPIHFFVHHVHSSPTQSAHVVNLKKEQSSVLNQISAIGPKKYNSAFEDAYQKIKCAPEQNLSLPEGPRYFARTESFHKINQNIETTEMTSQEDNTNDDLPDFDRAVIEKLFKPASKKIEPVELKIEQIAPVQNIENKIPTDSFWKKIQTNYAKNSQNATQNFSLWLKENFIIQKMAGAMIIFAIILIVPGKASSYYADVELTKNKIVSDSTNGFLSLQNSTVALMQSDLPTAQTAINEALLNFGSAVDTMQSKHQILQKIASVIPVIENEVKSRQALLLAGQKIALGNTYLLKGAADSQANASSTLEERMDIVMQHLHYAIPNYQAAMADLNTVDISALPLNYQGPFKDFKNIFGAVLNDLQNLSDLGGSLKDVFGAQGQRRYLLVFQNPAELRPTGGFLGSFAIMDVKDGKITNLDVPAGGTYDLQGQLDQYEVPPTPLLLTNKRWEFQDANWFPDFSASAQKILWFYRHSRNVTADGVIAINASVLERLLAITGPISDEKRGLTISADSALSTIQKVVETGPEKTDHKPKQILSDLAPQFITHFQNSKPKDLVPLLMNLQDALSKKEIQAYFVDSNAQSAVEQMGWSGKILPTKSNQDYLAVFNTNIHGQKSDAKIQQTISHQAIIDSDGTILDTVVISRTHTGQAQEEMYGTENIDYLRVYVPQGSELVSATGFTWPDEASFYVPENFYKKDEFLSQTETEIKIDEHTGTRITNEFGKTAFGNWVITSPGQTSQIQFTYRLPFKITDLSNVDNNVWQKFINDKKFDYYQLVVQKQSGIESKFDSQIILPSNWQASHQEGENIELAQNGANIPTFVLSTDHVWGLVIKNK